MSKIIYENFILMNYKNMTQSEMVCTLNIARNRVNKISMRLGLKKREVVDVKSLGGIYKIIDIFGNCNYGIIPDGTVFNIHTGYINKPKIDKAGYLLITLRENGVTKFYRVHRLIGIYFLEGRTKECCVVDHINGNKLDNSLSNLEWVTLAENTKRAIKLGLQRTPKFYKRCKINEDLALEIYKQYHDFGKTVTNIVKEYNLTKSIVEKVVNKVNWKHIHK